MICPGSSFARPLAPPLCQALASVAGQLADLRSRRHLGADPRQSCESSGGLATLSMIESVQVRHLRMVIDRTNTLGLRQELMQEQSFRLGFLRWLNQQAALEDGNNARVVVHGQAA